MSFSHTVGSFSNYDQQASKVIISTIINYYHYSYDCYSSSSYLLLLLSFLLFIVMTFDYHSLTLTTESSPLPPLLQPGWDSITLCPQNENFRAGTIFLSVLSFESASSYIISVDYLSDIEGLGEEEEGEVEVEEEEEKEEGYYFAETEASAVGRFLFTSQHYIQITPPQCFFEVQAQGFTIC